MGRSTQVVSVLAVTRSAVAHGYKISIPSVFVWQKDQNLVLNPTKVSGQCGRLKCCLAYEEELYKEARRQLPKMGRPVTTPEGRGNVCELDIPRMLVTVRRDDGTTRTYPANLLTHVTPAATLQLKAQPKER